MTHEERLELIHKPFPPIMAGHRVPSYPWAGTLIGGRGPMRTDEEAKRGRRVTTRGPVYDERDWSNKVGYYADRATD